MEEEEREKEKERKIPGPATQPHNQLLSKKEKKSLLGLLAEIKCSKKKRKIYK